MSVGYWDESYPPSIYAPPEPPVGPSTGASAGSPGVFTPPGSTPPLTIAGMPSIVATPSTAWTTGQYVAPSVPGNNCHWDGSEWVAGAAP